MTEKDIVLNFWKAMESNDFFAAAECLICKQIEYWPEEYAAAQWRAKWVERAE
ncbi:hypothetical protein [Vibrio alfacsensis]|uniref:hypothetical protein n=1 Tax=Vibrio alfacsensis TaxID=1074311 RepID=UPI004067E517